MGERDSSTPIGDAIKKAYEAKSIYHDGGKSVLGRDLGTWTNDRVHSMFKESIESLSRLPGVEKHLGKVLLMYSDVIVDMADNSKNDVNIYVARDYLVEARRLFEKAGAYDELEYAVAREVSLRGRR